MISRDEEEGEEVALADVETGEVDLRELDRGTLRLDAIHYAPNYLRAQAALKGSGLEIGRLDDFTRIPPYTLNRFRRVYVRDPSRGYPYLAPYEMLQFKVWRERYLSRKLTVDASGLSVKEGWILVTSSGTIGIPILVTKDKEGYVVSHDFIRIVPKEDSPVGYLYAWLASKSVRPLLARQEYGGIIKHMEAHQINDLPVPVLPETDIREADRMIREAWRLRDEANRLEREAIQRIDGALLSASLPH